MMDEGSSNNKTEPYKSSGANVAHSQSHHKNSSVVILVLSLIVAIATFSAAGFYILMSNPSLKESASDLTSQKLPFFLTLESPSDGSLAENNQLVVKGRTSPRATVVYFTDSDQGSTEADEKGTFSGTMLLASGINTLTVTAYNEDGEEKSIVIDVVYDDESTNSI